MESTSKSVLSSSEVAFPRGGSSVLTPLEVKEISNEATRDVLFEAAAATSSSKRTKSSAVQSNKRQKKQKKAPEAVEEQTVQIERFSFKTLLPGSYVLGQIVQVNNLDLAIAIGDNLLGYVPIPSISDEFSAALEKYEQDSDSEDEEEHELPKLSNAFKIGQWVRAKVATNESQRKRIELSIEPLSVNENIELDDLVGGFQLQASVKSIEDHGIILNIGILDLSGFISNKELKKVEGIEIEDLSVGSVLLTTVVSKPSSRTVNLKPSQGTSGNLKKVTISTISSIDSIKPGIIVDALIADVSKNGVAARVFGLLDGTFTLPHIGDYSADKLKHKFAIGSSVKARIIGVLNIGGTKKIILSQLPNILSLTPVDIEGPLEAFPVGHIFEEVTIKSGDSEYLYVDFGSADFKGQCHNSKIDSDLDLNINYTIGSKHKARVVGFNSIDNLLVVTLDPKAINAKFLNTDNIPVGAAIEGQVLKVLDNGAGLIVNVDGFEALVPSNHMSDIKLTYPERKFRIGSKIKGRILGKSGKKLLVTIRKSFTSLEDDQVLSSFADAKIGLKTQGTVDRFVHGGAIIAFFGKVKAFLPKSEVSETFVNDISEHLKVGQSVAASIININEEEQKLQVTLRQSAELTAEQAKIILELVPGRSIINVLVVEKNKTAVVVESEGSNLRGLLEFGHLSDGSFEHNRHILKQTAIGTKLEVLVLEKDEKSRLIHVSAKKSLIESAKLNEFPTSFDDIKDAKKVIHGYIKSVTNMGLFVSFGGKLTGLVTARYASEGSMEDFSKLYHKHQSVACDVIKFEDESQRFWLSLSDDKAEANVKLINPLDSTKKRSNDYAPGTITKGLVKIIKPTFLGIQLADNLMARIDITNCFNSWDEIENKASPLAQFKKDDEITAKVIGYHDNKKNTFSPIGQGANKRNTLELSLLKKDLESEETIYSTLKLEDIKKDQEYVVFINTISKGFIWANISLDTKARISIMELSDDASILNNLEENLPIGAAVKASLKGFDSEHNVAIFANRTNIITSVDDVKVGMKIPTRVLKVTESYVLVGLGEHVIASAFITDALNNYDDKITEVFSIGDFISATVIAVDKENQKVAVSLRDENAVDKCIESVEDLKPGLVIKGFIKSIANNGLFISLGRSIFALVRVSDVSDVYLKDWKKDFKLYQQVVGKIVSCKVEGRVLMTLKESAVDGSIESAKTFEELEVGDIYEGSIKRVMDFGVFVKLDGTLDVSGLCHHSEISDNKVENVSALFGEGDRVKVKVLDIIADKKQLSLGMKASYFTDAVSPRTDDMEVDSEDEEEDDDEEEDEDDDEDEEDVEDEVMQDAAFNSSDDESSDEEESSDKDTGSSKSLGLSTNGFDWTASILDQAEDNESSSDDEDFMADKKKKKKSKASAHQDDKTGDLNTRAPESVSDFERLLVGNPSSSILWMNYMSFQLQLGEIDKAREIGERALKTINYREEQEKMNIWIALLNLENTFGSDESLDEVFKRAAQYMDSLTMHQKLVGIFIMSEKYDKTTELFKTMTKKFGSHVSVWVQYGAYLLDRKLHDDAHEVLSRALQVLSKRDHIEVVKKFAQLEFNKGDPEQGRSLFEGLVSDAPKRIDLWNVYIDQEIKQQDKEKVEDLFERVVAKKLSRKQAKFFFSKWLSFEEEQGDEQSAARVKALATEYVQKNASE